MEDYVTFEQAKALRELGFDWEVNHYYDTETKEFIENHNDYSPEDSFSDCSSYDDHNRCWNCVSAPTLAQAQKWLREVKDTIIVIDFDNWCEKYGCHVYKKIIYNSENIKDSYGSMLVTNESNEDFDTYEQALSAGIDKALELLK